MTKDTIQSFLFPEHGVRGHLIHLNQAWLQMTNERHYPAVLSKLLGELTTFSVLLAQGLKHEGRITLQVQGEGPVNLLVVEAKNNLQIKGMAKTNAPIDKQKTADELLGSGQILVTLENTQTDHFYQSYVSREGENLVEALEGFLSQSEQLPSRLWVSVGEASIGAIYLQKMPRKDYDKAEEIAIDEDAWDRICHLTSTIKDEELLQLDNQTILHRLFNEEDVEVFAAKKVEYVCKPSRARIATMLQSLGEEEVRSILADEGEIVVFNDMCNYHERFNEEDVNQLFLVN